MIHLHLKFQQNRQIKSVGHAYCARRAGGERKAQICMYLVCMYVVCTYVRVYEVGCACTVLPDFCSLGATGIFFADSL